MNYELAGLEPLELKLQSALYREADDLLIDMLNAGWLHKRAMDIGDQDKIDKALENYEDFSLKALTHLGENIQRDDLKKRLVWMNRDKEKIDTDRI